MPDKPPERRPSKPPPPPVPIELPSTTSSRLRIIKQSEDPHEHITLEPAPPPPVQE